MVLHVFGPEMPIRVVASGLELNEDGEHLNVVKISADADGGCPHSCVCACATLCSAPIDTSSNFSAHVSAKSPLNISPKKN